MKKLIPLFSLIVLSVCLCGCASSRVEVTPDMGPIAIMSINISNQLQWEGEENSSGVAGLLVTKAVSKNGDEDKIADMGYTKSLYDDAVYACYDILENDFDMDVIPEDKLFSVQSYLDAANDLSYKLAYDQPKQYRALTYKNFVAPEVALETGARTFAYITFDVCKVMDTGIGKNGSCKGSVKASIYFADESGKFIAGYYGYARSEESVAAVLGVINESELMPYIGPVFREALYNAYNGIVWKKK